MSIVLAVLAGWYIRRKSAEILQIRRENRQVRRATRPDRREETWRQILEVRV